MSAMRGLSAVSCLRLCLPAMAGLCLLVGSGCTPSDTAEGQPQIYGDGSAGDLHVTASNDLLTLAADGNLQFASVIIDAGVVLSVPSGTIIRCTGSLTNAGTIQVTPGESGGGNNGVPGEGVSHASAGNSSRSTNNTSILAGGTGGKGLSQNEAMIMLEVTPKAGGAGGGLFGNLLDVGGSGGGGLLVLAKGALLNDITGSIIADGKPGTMIGAGGGAGGVVILASASHVTNAGQISAIGGNGAGAAFNTAGSGGGGGGIVHLISPSITASGTVSVDPGTHGVAGGAGNDGSRASGGGGGACGGNGGAGGDVTNAPFNTLNGGSDGAVGYSLQTEANPTALFW